MGIKRAFRDIELDAEIAMGEGAVILNDLDPVKDPLLIEDLILTRQDKTRFSIAPSCSCGRTTTQNTPGKVVGSKCDVCQTVICNPLERPLEPIVWIRAPEGIDGLINPNFLMMLREAYQVGTQKTSIFQWLLDPSDTQFNQKVHIEYMEANGVQRGISYFMANRDRIMALLDNDDVFSNSGYEQRKQLMKLYHDHKDILFPRMLPIIHKQFIMIEKTHIGSYTDMNVTPALLKAINTFISMKVERRLTPKKRDSIVARTLFRLADFYAGIVKNDLQSKKGLFRRHIVGSRAPFTARAVITSNHGVHDYDEIHYPWSVAVVLFEIHITNYLIKAGHTAKSAKQKIIQAVKQYDKEIDDIMTDIINSSPFRTQLSGKPGYPVIEQRNPSLKMASKMCFLMTKIKKDPEDVTKSLSILGLAGSNADFDGDQTNGMIPFDLMTAYSIHNLSPWHQVLSYGSTNSTSGDMNISKQAVSKLNNWLMEGVHG